jgi:hypothetical protein
MRPEDDLNTRRAEALLRPFEQGILQHIRDISDPPPDPRSEPTRYLLVQTYLDRVNKLLSILRARQLPPKTLTDDLNELVSWVRAPDSGQRERNIAVFQGADEVGNWLIRERLVPENTAFSETKRLLSVIQPKRGAPIKDRRYIVDALDKKITKGWTLSVLTRRVCQCGKASHDKTCTDKLRKQIAQLEGLLKQYGLTLVSTKNKQLPKSKRK